MKGTIVVKKPVLALCTNRKSLAKIHPSSGSPEDWLTPSRLDSFYLRGLSFDFFINWRTKNVSEECWNKRIVSEETVSIPRNQVEQQIYDCDGKDYVTSLCRFFEKYRLSCHYFLYKDSTSWNQEKENRIAEIVFDQNGFAEKPKLVSLDELMTRIHNLSGGPVRVGSKGLIYGLSSLECFLSCTDAAWPGDVDMLLIDQVDNPIAILEFKKHTLNEKIEDQRLSNFYPRLDRRKYDRLALLSRKFNNTPLVVIYYPTREEIAQVKIELVEGDFDNLAATKNLLVDLPHSDSDEECMMFISSLIEFIRV